jgi:hypothetical protein
MMATFFPSHLQSEERSEQSERRGAANGHFFRSSYIADYKWTYKESLASFENMIRYLAERKDADLTLSYKCFDFECVHHFIFLS